MSYAEDVLSRIQMSSGLCVGLDPSREQLLSWNLTDDLIGLKIFCDKMTQVCLQTKVAFVKPQSAFFERFGWEGLRILTEMNKSLRKEGIFTIFDGKRGDIGSTAAAYAEAYLSATDYSKFNAITLNPFLGYESLVPFIKKSQTEKVGVFIVVRSTNSESEIMQEALVKDNNSVAIWLAKKIQEQNSGLFGENNIGPIGAVVGSTLSSLHALLATMKSSLFLCPGIGAQGATIEQALEIFKGFSQQCIFPISRGITLNCAEEEALIKKIKQMKAKLFL